MLPNFHAGQKRHCAREYGTSSYRDGDRKRYLRSPGPVIRFGPLRNEEKKKRKGKKKKSFVAVTRW